MKINARIPILGVVIIIIFAGGAHGFSDAQARADAATLLARADALVANGSCDRVDFARELVQGHQKLRRFYPSAGIPDKSAALTEIKNILNKYCATKSPSSQQWVNPIITTGGGGVSCAACTPDDPTGSLSVRAPVTVSTPGCNDCGNVNALLLALIYIKPEEREKFIEKLTPELGNFLKTELAKPKLPLINVQKSIEIELNRPALTPLQVTPGNASPTLPLKNTPGTSPGNQQEKSIE